MDEQLERWTALVDVVGRDAAIDSADIIMARPNDDKALVAWRKVTAAEFISLANSGAQLYLLGRECRVYRIRRNGAVKTWKTRPGHFSAPYMIGYREAFRIEHDTIGTYNNYVLVRVAE